jgi:acyl carrier protein
VTIEGPSATEDTQETIEAVLLQYWRETLDNDTLAADDDPLMLGATSMQIMSVVARLAEEKSIEVPVDAMFDAITIADQAEVLASAL